MNRERLADILGAYSKLRIAVVGDFFLDKWLQIDRSLDEPSIETGLTAYQVVKQRLFAGAAGTVLSNLAALEIGSLYALGFVGDDGDGFEVRRILSRMGVDITNLFLSEQVMTPAYTKPMFMIPDGGEEETNRLDTKNTKPTPAELEQKIIDALWAIAPKVDAIIALDQLTDQGKGVITPRLREALAKVADAHPDLILYADSRAFIKEFHKVIVKCNNLEVVRLTGMEGNSSESLDQSLDFLGDCMKKLSDKTGREVFVTCGPRGVLVQQPAGAPKLIPAVPVTGRIDIVGAGDACTSGIVATLCTGATPEEAALVGNLVSSITIQVIGTTGTATQKQVLDRFSEYSLGEEAIHG